MVTFGRLLIAHIFLPISRGTRRYQIRMGQKPGIHTGTPFLRKQRFSVVASRPYNDSDSAPRGDFPLGPSASCSLGSDLQIGGHPNPLRSQMAESLSFSRRDLAAGTGCDRS